MKLSILFAGIVLCTGVAFADDATVQNITERRTCAEVKSDIDALSAMEKLDDVNAEKLKQLQVHYRANCLPKSIGRRTVARNIPVIVKNVESTASTTTPDALSEYLANKKSNCDKLNSEIEKLEKDDSKSDMLASMRGVYEMDCTEKSGAATAVATEKTDEQWAAEYDANLAAGLCGDGTKPNKYGCCTDETFKDMGNLVFACCPKSGGDCFPPITSVK